MPDNNNKNTENITNHETQKKRSFFWWEINSKTKDLLDFRYNTQEEIDKLNEEMTITDDLDEIMKQTNNSEYIENIDIDDKNGELSEIENKEENEPDSEENSQPISDSLNNEENNNFEELDENKNEPIEWEVIENLESDKEDIKDKNKIEEKNDIDISFWETEEYQENGVQK